MTDLVQHLILFAVAIPAIVLHEISHGYVSFLLGDPTAKERGRLSLNPLVHVDPIGTILLPGVLALMGAPVFGYAKPVPINPHYYRNYRTGMMLTGLAGPATNLTLAALSGGVVRVLNLTGLSSGTVAGGIAFSVFYLFATINLLLMFFNLIPIPPFDGSRVIPMFLSDEALRVYHQIERAGFVLIFALIYFGQGLLERYFTLTVDPVLRLLTGV